MWLLSLMPLEIIILNRSSESVHSHGDVTITAEGLHILTFAQHLWPFRFSSDGSIACYTYCDTGHTSKWSSPKTHDTHTYCRVFCGGAVTTCFNTLGLSRLEFGHPTFRLRGEHSNLLCHRHVL